jgi:hypothetical protein
MPMNAIVPVMLMALIADPAGGHRAVSPAGRLRLEQQGYKPTCLAKRVKRERAWDLQRQEDTPNANNATQPKRPSAFGATPIKARSPVINPSEDPSLAFSGGYP